MLDAVTRRETPGPIAHREMGFGRTYVFSTDHKVIGKEFLFLSLFTMALLEIGVGLEFCYLPEGSVAVVDAAGKTGHRNDMTVRPLAFLRPWLPLTGLGRQGILGPSSRE